MWRGWETVKSSEPFKFRDLRRTGGRKTVRTERGKWFKGRRKICEKLGARKNDKTYFMRFSKNKRNNITYYKNILDASHASPISHPCGWRIPNGAKQAFRLMKCTWKLILFPDLGLGKPIGKSVLQAKAMTKSRQPLSCLEIKDGVGKKPLVCPPVGHFDGHRFSLRLVSLRIWGYSPQQLFCLACRSALTITLGDK